MILHILKKIKKVLERCIFVFIGTHSKHQVRHRSLCSHSTKKQHTVGRDTVVLCNKTSDTKQFSEHVTRNSAEIRAVFYHEMFISESVQVISSGISWDFSISWDCFACTDVKTDLV